MSDSLLNVDGLEVHFDVRQPGIFAGSRPLKAVDGVSFVLNTGETLGIVGESGCGKSTLARAILRLVPMTAGKVVLLGSDLAALNKDELRQARRDFQIIFQDPLASLDPRMTVGQIISEPLTTHFGKLSKDEVTRRVKAMMQKVGLLPNQINRYPHEYSGGQCQRIGIARALVLEPKLVVCDEPVSALDVSIQAQIINLLKDLQDEMDLSLIFIAHDLSVVRHISDKVLVMYMGRAVETASGDTLYTNPRHPYTRALIAVVPIPDPAEERAKDRTLLRGELPSPMNLPSGCRFRTRCPYAIERCATEEPQLRDVGASRVACHRAEEI
ncbi:MAG: dipeptide ABC transporter ATP-binding protein [Gammaproteobacteria bacterium]